MTLIAQPSFNKPASSSYDLETRKNFFDLVSIIALLICMPFINLFPIPNESQPLYLLPMTLYILMGKRVNKVFLIFLFTLSALFLVSLLRFPVKSAFASYIAIICPIIVFYFILKVNSLRLCEKLFKYQYFFLLVSLIQQFASAGVSAILLGWLKLLIPRLTLTPLSEWDRGISIVASEPSSMIPLLFMMLAVNIFLFEHRKISRIHYYFSLTAVIFMGFLTQSITFIITMMYVIFALGIYYLLNSSLVAVVRVFFFSGLCLVAIAFDLFPTRFSELLMTFEFSFDAFVTLNELSGSRIGIALAPYCNVLDPQAYSYGFGSWSENFVSAAACFPIELSQTSYFQTHNLVNVKPGSLPSLLLVDFGFLGVTLLLLLCGVAYRYLINNRARSRAAGFGIVGGSVASIIIGGFPLTLPHFWIALVIFLKREGVVGRFRAFAKG